MCVSNRITSLCILPLLTPSYLQLMELHSRPWRSLSLHESLLTPVAHVLIKPSATHALLLEINLLSSSGQTFCIPGLVEKAIYFYSLPPLNKTLVLAFSGRRVKFVNWWDFGGLQTMLVMLYASCCWMHSNCNRLARYVSSSLQALLVNLGGIMSISRLYPIYLSS